MEVTLQGVSETLLIPLWARAYETQKEHPLIKDEEAVRMVSELSHDFSHLKKAKYSQLGIAIRTIILDREARLFIEKQPKSLIINLACGLDTRFHRMNNGEIQGVNIDFPDVINLRKKLIPNEPSNVINLGFSMFDPAWIDAMPASNKLPVLFIMEGASMYFTENELKNLFTLLSAHFPHAEFLLEVTSPIMVHHQKHHDAVSEKTAPFRWGLSEGKDLEKLHPAIHYHNQWSFYEGYRKHWGIMGLLSLIPWWNKNINNKIIHFDLQA